MLTELAPYRETGHRLLMEALARRGNVAEALRAYERLRGLLRDELGIAPSPTVQGVHRRLLESAGS
jgi:pentatricopeptide repeat protein